MIEITVKLFAMLRDIAGADHKVLTVRPPVRAAMVVDVIMKEYPRMRELKDHIRVAVNWEYAEGDRELKHKDEVALIPPVSGG